MGMMFTDFSELHIEVIRSWRRTFSVQVMDGRTLRVRAPMMASKKAITEFLEKTRGWIEKRLQRVRNEEQAIHPLTLEDGEQFYLWGRKVTLRRVPENILIMDPAGTTLYMGRVYGKTDFSRWLVLQLQSYLKGSVQKYAALMGLTVPVVKIARGHSRWGYCNYKNELGFNWHLAFCPPDCIDYVVVHELSHIRHKSHQRDFWAQVESILPDRKQREMWLKKNGRVMVQL